MLRLTKDVLQDLPRDVVARNGVLTKNERHMLLPGSIGELQQPGLQGSLY